jgi:hypothetical protein
MPTGYEVETYRNIGTMASALERIAAALEALGAQQAPAADRPDDKLALWFDPQSIRDHFGAADNSHAAELVAEATDDDLLTVAENCLASDTLYEAFHDVLADNVEIMLGRGATNEQL